MAKCKVIFARALQNRKTQAKMNILLFIGMLKTGGAERQISVLANELSGRDHKVILVTLFPGGNIANDLSATQGIDLMSLWSKRSDNIISRLLQILFSPLILRRLTSRVDCIYSMLEVTNFIAWLATRYKKNVNVVWGIRSSNMKGHWKMAMFDKLCAFVSPSINLLIVNSYAGLEYLLKRGYRPQRYTVIHNGIDTERFQYDEESRKRIRHELSIPLHQLLIGVVGRLDPKKDYPTFLRAAALVVREHKDVKFICVGGGPDVYADELHALTKELGLKERVIWLGDRRDIVSIYSALDILVSSSSYGEGFSNVIGEAMSCGVPCVVTDVGDSARIVGNSTLITEPGNPGMLSVTICGVIEKKGEINWHDISRDRIVNNFTIGQLTNLTDHELSKMNE